MLGMPPPAAREHGGLLLLWFTVMLGIVGSLGALTWGGPGPRSAVPWLGPVCLTASGVALAALIGRMIAVGYTGYERWVGLRIILRQGGERAYGRGIVLCVAAFAVGVGVLLAFGEETSLVSVRLAALLTVAVATFVGLLLVIARYFSVFGTTSIVCTVIGVAALVVVQSVGTGFLHEFERRVTGVYAHINVTRVYGLSEYRRFERWLEEVPGVTGVSPFVYYVMAMASEDVDGRRGGDVRPATVLVKGIDPATGPDVIDLVEHLERVEGDAVAVDELEAHVSLRPVLDRPDLPEALARIPDPRGDDWFEAAQERYEAQRPARPAASADRWDDDWVDPPEIEKATPNAREPQGGAVGAIGETTAASAESAGTGGTAGGEALPTMFVGRYLADRLELSRGDVVRLVDPGTAFDASKAPRFRSFEVRGVFEAGFQEYDERLVYVHIEELQAFRFRDADMVSGVDLRLADPNDASRIGRRIREDLREGYQVLEWQDLNRTLFSSIRQQKNVITVVLSLVIFVAGFNVLSALWTMVVRRTPEVAIMMSMGGTPAQVARVFQVTGMTIGLAGASAGIVFGLVLCWLVRLYGYTLDPQVYFIESLPVEVSPVQIVLVLLLALAICFVATIPPALRAAWQRPVDGLRYE